MEQNIYFAEILQASENTPYFDSIINIILVYLEARTTTLVTYNGHPDDIDEFEQYTGQLIQYLQLSSVEDTIQLSAPFDHKKLTRRLVSNQPLKIFPKIQLEMGVALGYQYASDMQNQSKYTGRIYDAQQNAWGTVYTEGSYSNTDYDLFYAYIKDKTAVFNEAMLTIECPYRFEFNIIDHTVQKI
jgi:hypothetical protein